MQPENWNDPAARCVAAQFHSAGFEEQDARGEPITDGEFMLISNAHYESIEFRLPADTRWRALVDTGRDLDPGSAADEQRDRYVIGGRSLALLLQRP
jgi:glycogen operon protein